MSPRTLRKTPSVSEVDKLLCKPFVKWVGGKTQLLSQLLSRLPDSFECYHEPFLGGGALFFSLQPEKASLSDVNGELIGCYRVVKSKVKPLISALEKHIYESDYYYELRGVDRSSDYQNWSSVEKAARLIYLNKTCFNGLYRVNSKGHFNTPIGKYSNPKIVDEPNLLACGKVLQKATLRTQRFSQVNEQAKKDDFVYFDPPYVPLSDTAYFTNYAQGGFGPDEQTQLRETCRKLDKRGVKFMLSNSHAQFVLDLYKEFNIEEVQATRAINSKGSKRGKVLEVIVRNYQ